jgi:cell division transport system permease protein
MGLALALPLLFDLVLVNAGQLYGDLRSAAAISVFLKPHLEPPAVAAAAQRLGAQAGVANVVVRTPAQGLEEFRAASGFAAALDALGENPLPAVLLVTPAENVAGAEASTRLEAALRSDADVDQVQSDAAWRQRLAAILALANRSAGVLATLLALALLLVIGNTVRLDVLGRAEEIAVMQLLGASNAFVRRPFLYTGLWFGIGSALLALAIVAGVEYALAQPVQTLVASYDHRFSVRGLGAAALGLVTAGGAALGWLGAWIATARHLWRAPR